MATVNQQRTIFRVSEPLVQMGSRIHTPQVNVISPAGVSTPLTSPAKMQKLLSLSHAELPTSPSESVLSPYRLAQSLLPQAENKHKRGISLVKKDKANKFARRQMHPSEEYGVWCPVPQNTQKSDPVGEVKKENARLVTENLQLRKELEKKSAEKKAFTEERISTLNDVHQIRVAELVHSLTQSNREKERLKGIVGELEKGLRQSRQENVRLSNRLNEAMQISQRVQSVELHCRSLEQQLERDTTEWNHDRRRLENLNS